MEQKGIGVRKTDTIVDKKSLDKRNEMSFIPESYIRYNAFTSALLCWALYGSVIIACAGCALAITSGLLPEPESLGVNTAELIIIAFLILVALEVLVYFLFIRKYLETRKQKAFQEAVAYIDDPQLLAQIHDAPQGSHKYYELVIQGYQDFMVGLGYTTILLFFPSLLIGLFLAIPIVIPFAAAEGFQVIPEDSAMPVAVFLGQIIAVPLWYKLGFYPIYRRGRIKNLMKGKGVAVKAPRPGKYQ